MITDKQLAHAITELKACGPHAQVPSSDLVQGTLSDWANNPRGRKREYRWRQACLIHGAILGLNGEWQAAAYVYGGMPDMPPASVGCEPLATLMAIGQSVSLWHMADPNAGNAALGAEDYFSRLPDDATFGQWRGVGLLIMSITRPHTVHTPEASASAAAAALRLLNPALQPETYKLASIVNGRPGCYRTQLEIITEQLGEIPAYEGLYLFN